jgi:hypothetical protein
MRQRAVAIAIPLMPLMALACFASGTPPGPDDAANAVVEESSTPEASPPDATLDVTEESPVLDAPAETLPEAQSDAQVEAAVDAPAEAQAEAAVDAPPDVSSAPVTVTVLTTLGLPEPGVMVVFDDASGNYLSSAPTDAAGRVVQQVATGTQITALFGSQAATLQLLTWIGVEPGDALTAVDTTAAPSPAPQLQLPSASLPTPVPSGAVDYDVFAGTCTSSSFGLGGQPATLSLYPECAPGGTFPLLVLAQDTSINEVGYTFLKGNTLTADGGLPAPSLTGATWQTTNGTAEIDSTSHSSLVMGAFTEVADGVPHSTEHSLSAPIDAGPALSATFPTHPGYADFVQSEVSIGQNSGCVGYVQALASRAVAATNTLAAFDVAQLPPATSGVVDAASVDGQPTVNLGATLVGGTFVELPFTATNEAGAQNGVWTFVVPPSVTSFTAPALPATASAWVPGPGADYGQGSNEPTVVTVDGVNLTYAEVRQAGGTFGLAALQRVGSYGAIVAPLPASIGKIRMSVSIPNAC